MASTDMICEAHPRRSWPHDDCPGPGMPPIVDPVQRAWAIMVAHSNGPGYRDAHWRALDRIHRHEVELATVTAFLSEPHCPLCLCLWDDHQQIEEVDDGIPFSRMGAGEIGPDEIITCGSCTDCHAQPPDYLGTIRSVLRLLRESVGDA